MIPPKNPAAPSKPATTTAPRGGKQQQSVIEQPKSPPGHQHDYTPRTKRKGGEESPLFRKSLIGLRPYSPTPTCGVPDDMKIPHGLENPVTKKEKGADWLKEEGVEKMEECEERGDEVMTDDEDGDWEDEEGGKVKFEPR